LEVGQVEDVVGAAHVDDAVSQAAALHLKKIEEETEEIHDS
jgi:hypothetical protein